MRDACATIASDAAGCRWEVGRYIVLLAVGTPMRRGDGHADLSFVYGAVEEIAPHLDGFTVIVTSRRCLW